MIWPIPNSTSSWLLLDSLLPDRVLDDLDGPRLFTLRTADQKHFLAYLCGEDAEVERFLLVPTTDQIVSELASDKRTLRQALEDQAWMWVVDRGRDGKLTVPALIDASNLPKDALPAEGAYIGYSPEALLRLRLMGRNLDPRRVPASVVRRAVDGATNAVKVLVGHVLDVQHEGGRPVEWFRRFYDLPATEFAFRSFEITFGMPTVEPQIGLDDRAVIEQSAKLLQEGIAWAKSQAPSAPNDNSHWNAIVEAMAHLTPPRKGDVEVVEISGLLTGNSLSVVSLSRTTSDLVATTRKQLAVRHPSELSYDGYVRELDKDGQTFWLRDGRSANIVQVSFSNEQFDSVWLPFDADRLVTVLVRQNSANSIAELTAIAFKGGDDPLGESRRQDSWGSW